MAPPGGVDARDESAKGRMPMPDTISSDLEQSLAVMEKRLYRQVNTDINRRLFRVYRREAAVYFVDGMTLSLIHI